MKRFVFFLLAVLCPGFVLSQEFLPVDSVSVTHLTSKDLRVWDRNNSACTVALKSTVSESDTVYTLSFVINDRKGLHRISAGEPLTVHFLDGREIQLQCNNNYEVGKGHNSMLFLGFLPFFFTINFDQVCPQYEISKDDLLSIVSGEVSSLTFYMEGTPYFVKIRSDRFSLVMGENCASLKPNKHSKNAAKISSKSLFGDAKLRRNTFGWNNRFSFSLGVSHMYSSFDSHYFSMDMPKNMFEIDMTLKGFFMGFGVMNYTDDFIDRQTYNFKVGPAFRYGNMRSSLIMSPYIGAVGGETKDSHNYGSVFESKSYFIAGMRIAYEYKHLHLSVNASNRECGATIGLAY